jgi:hypothetical protein
MLLEQRFDVKGRVAEPSIDQRRVEKWPHVEVCLALLIRKASSGGAGPVEEAQIAVGTEANGRSMGVGGIKLSAAEASVSHSTVPVRRHYDRPGN